MIQVLMEQSNQRKIGNKSLSTLAQWCKLWSLT